MKYFRKIVDFYNRINDRVKEAGIYAFVWGVIALGAWLLSMNGLALVSLGIFITRNWDLLSRWVKCQRESGSDENGEDNVNE